MHALVYFLCMYLNRKHFFYFLQGCRKVQGFHNVIPEGMNLSFLLALYSNNGNYTCVVTYPENGRAFNLTRTLAVKVVGKHD